MNIKEAKEEIKNAMTAYFSKDEFGEYEIPIMRQRPVFLMGPPGIGKTAIMEQIAAELGVGIISYSMTHHTRQSALGLPFIETKTYGGKEYSVSEYTMSEIIASVYDIIENTGKSEGILFLDEINCVSETLAPSMLQFLQYKIFGRHKVPDGWIVVTAGNPPEYNNSVREFDIVTWDRLKRIDIEPDYDVWKEFAVNTGVHPAITTYLDIKKGDFYKIETTVDGKSFVTARGWCDLSDMVKLYEKNNIKITEKLVVQYLQNRKIAKEFAIYYDLFNKYKSDYQVDKILAGEAVDSIISRIQNAKFDERLAVISLLLDGIGEYFKAVSNEESMLRNLMNILKAARIELSKPGADAASVINNQIKAKRSELYKGRAAGSLTGDEQYTVKSTIAALEVELLLLVEKQPKNAAEAFAVLKEDFDSRTKALKKHVDDTGEKLSNAFKFCEDAFGEGQEILIFITELTISSRAAQFISRYGCKEYFAHNKELLFYERQKEIIIELENFEL